MTLLEDSYRRTLRLLPRSYRDRWEEDMVAAFLESAYAANPDDPELVDLGRPGWAERLSVARLAVRLRLGGHGAPPRAVTWGAAVRLVALVGLLAHSVAALVAVAFAVWFTQRWPGLRVPAGVHGFDNQGQALWSMVGLLWLPAYLSVLHGHWRAARITAWTALAAVAVTTVAELVTAGGAFTLSATYWLLFQAVPVLALAAFHDDAPPVTARPWLVALPVGAVAAFAVLLPTQPAAGHELLVDWSGLWCAGVAVAAVVAVRRRAPAPWQLALVVLAVAAAGLRLVTLTDILTFAAPLAGRSALIAVAVAEAVTVLAAAAVLGVRERRIRYRGRSVSP